MNMMRNRGKAMSLPGGVSLGVGVCVLGLILGSLLLAWMISGGRLAYSAIGTCCAVLLAISSAIGAVVSCMAIKRRYLMAAEITGAAFIALLLIVNAIFFDGIYSGVAMGTLMILIGSGSGAIIVMMLKKPTNWKRRKMAFR